VAQTRTVYKRGRHYVWPERPPHELEVVSVTTIIGGGIPKPALAPWNAKMVATFAVENKAKWMELDDADAIDLLKRSPFRQTRKRADEGTLVHAALEAYAAGEEEVLIPPEEIGLTGQYNGAVQFLRELNVEILHAEATVFSREHQYAGTSDIFGHVTLPPPLPQGRKTAVIDYKTGKAIYPEYAVQLAAYAFGDFIGLADGTEVPVPDVDYLIVVRPKRRGGFEAAVYEADREIFEVFLAAKTVHERERMLQGKEIGRQNVGPDDRE
jgi:hypothetical protein